MKISTDKTTQNKTGRPAQILSIGFKPVIRLLSLSCLAAILAQNFYQWFDKEESINWIGISGVVLITVAFIYYYGRDLYSRADKPYFAITSLLFITLGTILGTLVVQNTSPEVFMQQYGESGSQLLRIFCLEDVFHSWWFVLLFLLLALSLVKISMNREFSIANLGFHLAHLGPIVVLAGVWLDYFAGYRGLIQLNTGQETSFVNLYQTGTNRVVDSHTLDFKVRLNHFESENFEPDHRIQLWRNETVPHVHNGTVYLDTISNILATFPMKVGKTWKIHQTEIEIHLAEFYPNFYLEYSFPERPDTIEPNAPGMMLELTTPHGQDLIQFMANIPGRNIFDLPNLGAALEFHWEMPGEYAKGIANFSPNSDMARENRILFDGSNNIIHEIINGQLTSRSIEIDSFYPIPGKENIGFTVLSVFPDIEYLNSEPKSRDDEQLNPVARLEVSGKDGAGLQNAFLYPGWKGPGGQYFIPGTDYFIALESIKDKETKFWKSDIALINEQDKVIKSKSIVVNEPLRYGSYRFYQSDYDPGNPRYSGIGISYTPGLYVIYLGFFLLSLGIIKLFYLRAPEKETEEEAGF